MHPASHTLMALRPATVGCLTWTVAWAAACGARSGLPDPPLAESSPDASTLVDSAAPSGTTVRGKIIAHYTTDSGVVDRGVDLSKVTIDAFAELADGTFATVHGTGSADGSFVVSSVPDGPYQLRIGSTVLVHPATRDLSLSVYVAGRPDAVVTYPLDLAEVQLDVDNLSPWQAMPPVFFPLVLASSNAGCEGVIRVFNANAPMPGDTALVGVLATIQSLDPEIDETHGDRATLVQLAQRTGPDGAVFTQAVRALDLPSPRIHVRPPFGAIRGSFRDVVADKALTVSWDTARFASFAQRVLQAAKPSQASFGVSAFLVGPPPTLAPPLRLLTGRTAGIGIPAGGFYVDASAAATPHRLAFGEPWTTAALLWGGGLLTSEAKATIPDGDGGTMAVDVLVAMGHYGRIDPRDGAPLEPMLAPPTNIRINGVDVFAGARGAGSSPVFTWDAAASMDPSFGGGTIVYDLAIDQIATNPRLDAGFGAGPVSMIFRTTETRIALPPGIVALGQTYAVRLSTLAVAGTDPSSIAYDLVSVEAPPFAP